MTRVSGNTHFYIQFDDGRLLEQKRSEFMGQKR